jgi:hypothetical protein
MATLSAQVISLDGTDPTLAAVAAGGDQFANTGHEYFDVNNGSAAAVTVTFATEHPCDQGFTHNAAVAVAAGARRRIGPFPVPRFGRTVEVTYSAATSVTAAVVKLP